MADKKSATESAGPAKTMPNDPKETAERRLGHKSVGHEGGRGPQADGDRQAHSNPRLAAPAKKHRHNDSKDMHQEKRPTPVKLHHPSSYQSQPSLYTTTGAGASTSAVVTATSPSSPVGPLHHPFRANFNDHFETSIEALRDVLPFLSELRQLLRPSTPERFTLYDPYFCAGSVVAAWASLGLHNVLHENRDFYSDIEKNTVPGPYDVLVTNPPFSEDHIWRLMEFLATQQSPLRPWAFVAPDYIASKPQYKAWLATYYTPSAVVASMGPAGAVKGAAWRAPPPSLASNLPPFLLPPEEGAEEEEVPSASASAVASRGPEPFYLVPRTRYDYAHPLGVGHDHSHFKSMWYVWAGRHTAEVLRGVSVALSGRGRGSSDGAGRVVTVVPSYASLVSGRHVSATEHRPNPQRRSRQPGNTGGKRGRY